MNKFKLGDIVRDNEYFTDEVGRVVSVRNRADWRGNDLGVRLFNYIYADKEDNHDRWSGHMVLVPNGLEIWKKINE